MTNSTIETDQAALSRPRPLFGFYPLNAELKRLRQEAIADIVTVQPPEKVFGLHSYDSPKACIKMHEILETQVRCPSMEFPLWLTTSLQTHLTELMSADIGRRVREPEAFRLSVGHEANVPEEYLGRAVLLSQYKANFRIRHRGILTEQQTWEPDQELHFNGALVAGAGHMKFSLAIYELNPRPKEPTLSSSPSYRG